MGRIHLFEFEDQKRKINNLTPILPSHYTDWNSK